MNEVASVRTGDRREQILDAAQRLFVERGIGQVSTREIARAVGISQPSLYAHFKSRDDIAIELAQRAFVQLRERMISLAQMDGQPTDRLRAMGREYVRFGLEQSAAYRVAFMLERHNLAPENEAKVHDAGLRAFGLLHDVFRQARQADDAATAIRAESAWASMHGLVSLLLARPDFEWADRDALIETHLDRLCVGAFE